MISPVALLVVTAFSWCSGTGLPGMSFAVSGPAADTSRDAGHEFDLQYFAAEDEGRTEDPTEKKKNEAMQEGQIPVTEDFPDGLMMGLGFLVVWIYGGMMITEIMAFTRNLLTLKTFSKVTPGNVERLIVEMIWINVKVGAPVAAAAMIGGVGGYVTQTGLRFSPDAITFDLSQLQPSLKNMFEGEFMSPKSIWGFAKSLLKLIVVGAVALEVIYTSFDRLLMLIHVPITESVIVVVQMAFEIIFKAVLLLLIISPFDYWFEYNQWFDQLKMTKKEKDDEKKQQEGDPNVQEKQQERMEEMAEKRMMEEVPEADVVITNPTEYAVALKYEENNMTAPEIVAKGTDMVAQRIRQLARDNDIPIYEIPLLARTLHQFELDEEIPATLYETVATVLAWVHNQRDDVSDQEKRQVESKVEGLDVAAT
jgi:flagellar biosynthetic protein FlhB